MRTRSSMLAALAALAACSPDDDPKSQPPGSLADAVTDARFAEHLQAIQDASPESAGWRTAGSEGDAAVRGYVAEELEALGWSVREDPVQWGLPLRTTANLVADGPTGDEDAGILLLVAHGDSQAVGPGMNDNGSGVVGLLTIAEALDAWPEALPMRVRLLVSAWEEGPAVGAHHYLAGLDEAEEARHVAFINLDMLGSVAGGRFVLDPALGGGDIEAPPGSGDASAAIAAGLDDQGLPWAYTPELGADHVWALQTSIPTTFVFSGLFPKTDEEAALFGGLAGEPMDPCYHQACDTVENVDVGLAIELVRATAYGLEALGGPAAAR